MSQTQVMIHALVKEASGEEDLALVGKATLLIKASHGSVSVPYVILPPPNSSAVWTNGPFRV